MRTDGDFTIFMLEYWEAPNASYAEGRWVAAGGADAFWTAVPVERRFEKPTHDGKSKEPFRTFTASGDCWQKTGLHGSFEFEPARALAEILAKHNKDRLFRVAKLVLSQKREVVYEPPVLEHRTSRGFVFLAGRRDLETGVTIQTPPGRLFGREALAGEVCEFSAWHALHIFPTLTGFPGYDCIRFRIEEAEVEEPEDLPELLDVNSGGEAYLPPPLETR